MNENQLLQASSIVRIDSVAEAVAVVSCVKYIRGVISYVIYTQTNI
jgi:hypothetical protein